jgi:hypothetical protein
MTKRLLNWKNVVCHCAGRIEDLPLLNEIDSFYYQGTLLSQILAMEKKTPISADAAIQLLLEYEDAAQKAGRKGHEPGQMFYFSVHFVEWLSDIGYHVEITGDEFDPYNITDQVS